MGTEKDKIRSVNRNRPPPIPPRPQHLIPVKAISKYSSMPDILNGWKKDTNPDLLKVNDAPPKKSVFSISRGEYRLKNGADYAAANGVKNNTLNGNVVNYDRSVIPDKAAPNGKTSRKFSCIPSRNNSKKKKNILSSINVCNSNNSVNGSSGNNSNNRNGKNNNRAEISQTSWYVEDVGNTMVQLSKCEITVNSDNGANNCRYIEKPSPVAVLGAGSTNSLINSERYRRFRSPMTSSSSLSGLPPLPKSLSDASLLWESADKKLSSYSINLSSSSSNASSCSRSSGGGVHAKALSSPKTVSSDELNKNATQPADAAVPRDDQKPTQPPPPPPRKPTSLDMKLAILRKEMHDLRQMDLSLLSQLWSLNEAIHEFRQMQESLSPHTPSSHSSDEDDLECYYSNVTPQGMVTSSQHNTMGSNSSRSSVGTSRNNVREA